MNTFLWGFRSGWRSVGQRQLYTAQVVGFVLGGGVAIFCLLA